MIYRLSVFFLKVKSSKPQNGEMVCPLKMNVFFQVNCSTSGWQLSVNDSLTEAFSMNGPCFWGRGRGLGWPISERDPEPGGWLDPGGPRGPKSNGNVCVWSYRSSSTFRSSRNLFVDLDEQNCIFPPKLSNFTTFSFIWQSHRVRKLRLIHFSKKIFRPLHQSNETFGEEQTLFNENWINWTRCLCSTNFQIHWFSFRSGKWLDVAPCASQRPSMSQSASFLFFQRPTHKNVWKSTLLRVRK